MTDVQPFVFPPTGDQVRVVMIDNEPWFVAADVCQALGIGDSRVAIKRLDDDEYRLVDSNRVSNTVERNVGGHQRYVVNESGLYSMILGSRKREAREFRRWVTSVVLPAIRKTGRFELVPQPQHQIPQSFAEALELAAAQAREIEEQRAALDWAVPRAQYVDRYVDGASDGSTLRDFANQIGVPERKLREWMINQSLIYKLRDEYRAYSQTGVRRHWFKLVDHPDIPRGYNGQTRKTLYITPAGKVEIEKLLGKHRPAWYRPSGELRLWEDGSGS